MSPELEKILAKVKNNEELTDDEERLYMKEVLKIDDNEINAIFSIDANKDPNRLID